MHVHCNLPHNLHQDNNLYGYHILNVIKIFFVVFCDNGCIFMHLIYNKNVKITHNNLNKSVRKRIYGTIDFE